MTRLGKDETQHDAPMCRQCRMEPATVAIRSGLEWHPTCEDCARWWSPARRGPLSEVDPSYRYEEEA